MTSATPVNKDTNREEYRKYLEKSGVLQALTKVLANLYEAPTKPPNAMEYIKNELVGKTPENAEINSLRTENGELRDKLNAAQAEIASLNEQLKAIKSEIDREASDVKKEASEKADGDPE